jgi:hypothetical protein
MRGVRGGRLATKRSQNFTTFSKSIIMKDLTLCFCFLPILLGAQCYGSFEIFGGAGVSGTPSTSSELVKKSGPIFVNRFGFGASILVGQRTLLRTSMQFSQYGERLQVAADDLVWGNQHDGNGGVDPSLPSGEIARDLRIRNRHMNVEGVIALRYEIPARGLWRPFAEGGFGVSKYGGTGTKVVGTETTRSYDSVNSFRNTTVVGRLGGGFDYNFNESVGIYAMPVLQYHLLSMNRKGLTKVNPWQATIEIGVRVFVDPK